ncbi:MAG: pentapeptide repeat-containing protein [Deltaproteobacteria bacterium]|nr:pentapeptide repeat-containing protein [Deltaproteobacteria bacterium]
MPPLPADAEREHAAPGLPGADGEFAFGGPSLSELDDDFFGLALAQGEEGDGEGLGLDEDPGGLGSAFACVAENHLRPVRAFLEGLRAAPAAAEQVRPLLPPLETVIESARSMGMEGLRGRVRTLTALLRGTLESGAREIDGSLREAVLRAWDGLAEDLPEPSGMEAGADPLDGLLLRTLLRLVPALDAHSLDRILGAGFISPDALAAAAPRDLAAVTGIAPHLCEVGVRLAGAYCDGRRERRALGAPADWLHLFEPKLAELERLHRQLDEGGEGSRTGRRPLRRERQRAALEIEMLLVEMGQLRLLFDLQRQRFGRRIEKLRDFAAGLRRPALRDILERRAAGESLQGVDLCDEQLEGISLAGSDLSGANLTGASLAGADLRAAVLVRACLRETFLQGADLTGAQLVGAVLEGACLANARLTAADLSFAGLEGADLEGAHLGHGCLRRARLADANLAKALLADADLRGADLADVDAGGADLQRADLRGAVLRGASLKGSDLRGADLRGADLQGASLDGAQLEGVQGLGPDSAPVRHEPESKTARTHHPTPAPRGAGRRRGLAVAAVVLAAAAAAAILPWNGRGCSPRSAPNPSAPSAAAPAALGPVAVASSEVPPAPPAPPLLEAKAERRAAAAAEVHSAEAKPLAAPPAPAHRAPPSQAKPPLPSPKVEAAAAAVEPPRDPTPAPQKPAASAGAPAPPADAEVPEPRPPALPVLFRDQALERCVRRALSRPEGQLSENVVAQISELDCSTPRPGELDVVRLDGIEFLSNLNRLDLSHNAVTDIAPLSHLGKLEQLNLRGNCISNLAPLSRLGKLEQLNLRANRISDIRPVSALPARCEIDLLENPIDDIAPLLTRGRPPAR